MGRKTQRNWLAAERAVIEWEIVRIERRESWDKWKKRKKKS
jgi:hypothetical protein